MPISLVQNILFLSYRFNIQSGLWRCAYGKSKAHSSPIRGVATDCLNQVVVSGGLDAKVKFWPFKYKGKIQK